MEHQLETGSVFLIGRWEWRTAQEHGSYYLGRLRAVNGGMDSSSIHYVNTMKNNLHVTFHSFITL